MQMLLSLIVIVSCVSISSLLYAPSGTAYAKNFACWVHKTRRHSASSVVVAKIRVKRTCSKPAESSLAKKKARIALKKHQLQVEEALLNAPIE